MAAAWLREAGALLFAATTTVTAAAGAAGDPEQDPLRRKLVEGVLYTRRFVFTYHLVVFGAVLVLTALNWTGRAVQWRQRQASHPPWLTEFSDAHDANDAFENDTKTRLCPYLGSACERYHGDVSSSESSIFGGTASPLRKDLDGNEEMPLLHNAQPVTDYIPGPQNSVLSSIRAFLMSQPRPIPFFNKVLPTNGTTIAVLAFIALNIFYMLYHIKLEIYQSFVVADRFGLLFVANLPYLYILAAKNQPLKFLTGRSYESLNLFHRRLGELLCFQALLHVGGMIVAWYLIIRPNGFGLVRFLMLKVIVFGLIAFLAYEILYFTSLASFRQRWYGLFVGLHIFLQVVALVFVFLHHPAGRPYVGIALAIFLVDRLVYRISIRSTNVEARATIMEDDETVKLTAKIPLQDSDPKTEIFGNSITNGWEAADHVFISVPSLSRGHALQSHPFTIASRAPGSGGEREGEATLSLIIRAQSGFSASLLMRARSHNTIGLRLDGPYGSSHARNILDGTDLALIVAGGGGIAVAWPLVHYLLDQSCSSDTEMACRSVAGKQRIVLIWVIHKGEHLDWIGRKALTEVESRGVEIVVPRATEEIGRPDLKSMIKSLVSEAETSRLGTSSRGKNMKIGVVGSGPDSMCRLVRNSCAEMIRDGKTLDVTIKKFGW
ncbi:hypothetical protein G7Y89_g9137 [Cudoniella acicularis]|uniref:FAD-binding FR-type domain-containing protein n=1 Tax=Cudoniella acicularis TaxID=354080 RepID=A0A8H4RF85_9HELO|nr:hypothetical protein G7Y89_g9137 [Cudoniella acicularis]